MNVLTISAKSKLVLKRLVESYIRFLDKNKQVDLSDMCFTANTGRDHYSHRFAIVFNSRDEIIDKLRLILNGFFKTHSQNGIYYGHIDQNSLMSWNDSCSGKISKILNSEVSKEAALKEICNLYSQGTVLEWEELYIGEKRWRISIPVYPFEGTSCWANSGEDEAVQLRKESNKTNMLDTNKENEINALDNGELILGDSLNEVERRIAEAWQKVLGINEFDLNDHFFELGGNSMKAFQIAVFLRKYNYIMEFRDLIMYPTIEQLSKHIKVGECA